MKALLWWLRYFSFSQTSYILWFVSVLFMFTFMYIYSHSVNPIKVYIKPKDTEFVEVAYVVQIHTCKNTSRNRGNDYLKIESKNDI